mmetsp:Transcript_10537/g.38774  ORF Transcript_10537/g.38774 Transcript_10537/m.38774 type:complete len:408 (+) Transcript_10537:148-1371(+)
MARRWGRWLEYTSLVLAALAFRRCAARIMLLTMATPNLEYASFTSQVVRAYALQHGYDYVLEDTLDPSIGDTAHPSWHKLALLRRHLQNKLHDAILWIDADAVVNNFEVRVEQFLQLAPHADLILCSDDAKLLKGFNAGVILVRNTAWSVNFLSRWIATISSSGFAWRHPWEQEALLQLFTGPDGAELRDHMGILEAAAFNTPLPVLAHHQETSFIFHAAGESAGIRNYLLSLFYSAMHENSDGTGHGGIHPYLGPRLASSFLRTSLIAHYQEQTNSEPPDPTAYNRLGIALTNERRFDEAAQAFEAAVELLTGNKPALVSSLYNLGTTYTRLRDHHKAATTFSRLLDTQFGISTTFPDSHSYNVHQLLDMSSTFARVGRWAQVSKYGWFLLGRRLLLADWTPCRRK